ncbi:MAG TPA: ATP-dependent protease ATPase subunit HslU [Thermomicrobiaceae bacterium]|nr:ATP-dependent protease ATPase subunit HslU [Thermomicrobiaceae bacterium]
MSETPAPIAPLSPRERELTPRRIVAELDRFIIGQDEAKRAAAIALRNRWRRQQLDEAMRPEVTPKNILMIGPTGVGKTEIARRLAKIVDAPFLKVEATKFTEVGYVGRDVEAIVRDLLDGAINMLHDERLEAVQDEAAVAATQRLADILVEQRTRSAGRAVAREKEAAPSTEDTPRKRAAATRRHQAQRRRMLELLSGNALEDETVELELTDDLDFYVSQAEFTSPEEAREGFGELLDGLLSRRRSRRVSVREARRILTQQEAYRMIDFDTVIEAAVRRTEEAGIVFIDEIDKTITNSDAVGSEVSGEGVQRDLLPIVEGSVVVTRYGPVRTDHILFVAAGAFSDTRPSDLIPELQGRFPIRVELASLDEEDLYAILTQPENALTKQYRQLLATEGVAVEFTEDGMREMARLAWEINERGEDIGARRLHTIVERVLEEISFEAPERAGEQITIDGDYVRGRVEDVAADDELSNFIL